MSNEETFRGSSYLAEENTSVSGKTHFDSPGGFDLSPEPASRRRPAFFQPDSFWHNRLVEFGLIFSMALYYLIGNQNIKVGMLYHLNPLFALPFLLIFCALCWYRLNFAIAFLPLALPFYLQQKVIYSRGSGGLAFSPAEIVLWICIAIAVLQLVLLRKKWPLRELAVQLRSRVGFFAIPIAIFFLAALVAIFGAYNHQTAMRAFREEVLDPILYLLLALTFLRTRQDMLRLVSALFGTGLLVAMIGLGQYLFFKNTLVKEADGRRIHAIYGSANDIGLLFDYTLPLGLGLIIIGLRKVSTDWERWGARLLVAVACVLYLAALYLTQSRGAEFALVAAVALILVCKVENPRLLLIGVGVALVVLVVGGIFLGPKLVDSVINGHTSKQGVSTVTKRLYLWESAWNMIQHNPIRGYGMDNWLCNYSNNFVCHSHTYHYMISRDPVTGQSTGLKFEPTLSHPHNIFLHVWVSTGLFGLLAFVAMIALFGWLFIRILKRVRNFKSRENTHLTWVTVGVGGAMLAALGQGLVDSAFLEQDLSFCFWMLITLLLLLRSFSGTSWRNQSISEEDTYKLPNVVVPLVS